MDSEKLEKCALYCFDVLRAQLENADNHWTPAFDNDDNYPLFVTWNIYNHRTGNRILRGCIGTFSAVNLADGLKEFAITSAFKDRRFKPITVKEFAYLSCSVSLLVEFESVDDVLDWEVSIRLVLAKTWHVLRLLRAFLHITPLHFSHDDAVRLEHMGFG
jgi:uncharacterized protein (TIGR00296 family)